MNNPILASAAAAALLAHLILPSPSFCGEKVLVSGQVAYRSMGIEKAEITAISRGQTVARVTSGYHGAFLLHLTPGSYVLKARGEVAKGRFASGELTSVNVSDGIQRLDRLTIPIADE